MGISYVPPVLGGAAGALGGRARPREEAEAVDGTGGVPACKRTGRCRPRRWIHGIVPWIGVQRLRRTATHVKMPASRAGRVDFVDERFGSAAAAGELPGPRREPVRGGRDSRRAGARAARSEELQLNCPGIPTHSTCLPSGPSASALARRSSAVTRRQSKAMARARYTLS